MLLHHQRIPAHWGNREHVCCSGKAHLVPLPHFPSVSNYNLITKPGIVCLRKLCCFSPTEEACQFIQSITQLFGFIAKYGLGERLFLDVVLILLLFNVIFFGKHQWSVQSGVNCSVIENPGITQALLQQKEKIKILIFYFVLFWTFMAWNSIYHSSYPPEKKNVCHVSGTR